MRREDIAIATARINARQAVVVAAITGGLTLVTTLIATGSLLPRRGDGSEVGTGTGAAPAPVLDAPYIYVSADSLRSSLDECMNRAKRALDHGDFRGARSTQYLWWGYRDRYVGAFWCHTDAKQVIFLAAGPDSAGAEQTRTILERSY